MGFMDKLKKGWNNKKDIETEQKKVLDAHNSFQGAEEARRKERMAEIDKLYKDAEVAHKPKPPFKLPINCEKCGKGKGVEIIVYKPGHAPDNLYFRTQCSICESCIKDKDGTLWTWFMQNRDDNRPCRTFVRIKSSTSRKVYVMKNIVLDEKGIKSSYNLFITGFDEVSISMAGVGQVWPASAYAGGKATDAFVDEKQCYIYEEPHLHQQQKDKG